MAKSNISIIIVAGGNGMRMGHKTPKQFLLLSGIPILIRTLTTFASALPNSEKVIVLPSKHIALWKNLCKKHNCDIQHTIIEGGKSRTCSVRNGLSCIEHKDGVVLIHDAVRPLATKTLLTNVLHAAEKYNAAIPVIDITDSLRKIEAEESHAVEREQYKAVQTPQGFNLELIRKAYHNAKEKEFTDDAALLESIGVKIALVDGEKTNIKITTPEDMVIARSILKKQIKI